jgi:uncharacterized protein (DUF302 family)
MKRDFAATVSGRLARHFVLGTVLGLGMLAAGLPGEARAQAATAGAPAMPALFLEDTSPAALGPTVAAFRSAVEAAGWSILSLTNMTGVLAERGFAIPPVLVFHVCSSVYSGELLGNDATMFVSSMMPCSVSIYQTSTGKVVISRMNSAAMGGMVGGRAGEVVAKSGQDMEAIIAATLKALAK